MEQKRLTTQEDYRQRVDRVTIYIREHLDSQIDIRTLADISAFSPFHFHRVMRAYLGEPIGAFIVRKRVEMAAQLLRYSDMSVSQIAYRVGYDTPSGLTKSFCKLFGISPKKYRLTKNYQIMTTESPKPEIKLSQAKVVQQEPKNVIYIAASGNYKNISYSSLYERMWVEIKRQGLFGENMEHIAVYYDNPEVMVCDNMKCDVCISVSKAAQPNEEIGVKTIDGGRFVMFTYTGPYSNVGVAYDKIYGELLAQGGFSTRDTFCYEIYTNDPTQTAPQQLETEIYIPIE